MESSTICPHCQFKLQSAPEVGNWGEPSISDGDEVEFESSKTYTGTGLLHFLGGVSAVQAFAFCRRMSWLQTPVFER